MTAPTFTAAGGPPKDDWSDLEDGTFDDVPSHAWSSSNAASTKTLPERDRLKPRPDQYARTDVASGVSLGSRASSQKTVNQVAQFKCDACNGSGRFVRGYNNPVDYGPCNKCKGTGRLKTDPETLARRKKARDEAKKQRVGDYISQHMPEYTWAVANMARFGFAASMANEIKTKGAWSDGQLAAIRRCMARDEERKKERKKEREQQAATAPQVTGAGFSKMLAAFASAKASGLKYPKLHIGEFTFALAGERSKYAGKALFVKHEQDDYCGRIDLEGRWFQAGEAGRKHEARIAEICKDPLGAAVLHGKQTGRCSCCGRELENEESVRLGIGPICRDKWGL